MVIVWQNGGAGLELTQIGRYADVNTGRRFGRELLIKYQRARVPELSAGVGRFSWLLGARLYNYYASAARILLPAGLRPRRS
jgi:hypothetical protein